MASNPNYCDITPEIEALAAQSLQNSSIDAGDYVKYDVKRGLRDLNGKGVLAGLTEISDIIAKKMVDGQEIPCDGKLYYRGIDVEKLVAGALKEGRFGFEETAYLLLLGRLPNAAELESFKNQLAYYRTLPGNFVRDVILKAPSQDIMNSLARSVLNLASYDERCDDISLPNVMRQCLQLIALFPVLSVYGYQAYTYKSGNSLYIHAPQPELSTAENILSLLRPDSSYSFWEAHVLDICLTLHAEHGGGNNSTFTTHVVTSSGTDTYSCMAAALASLKGPKHGGANIKVIRMFEDMKEQVKDWKDEDEVRHYLQALLDKQAFDRAGLIYGMGHAVYSLSDPRANLLHSVRRSMSCTPWWSGWAPRSSPGSGRCIRAYPPMWTFIPVLSTTCWICPWSSIPPSLPWPGWPDGAPTVSRSSSTWAKSSARPTSMWGTTRIMRRLRSGDLKSIRKKCVRR